LNYPVQLNLDFTAQNQGFFNVTRPKQAKNPNFLGFFAFLGPKSLFFGAGTNL
jgi:hypothetical protein